MNGFRGLIAVFLTVAVSGAVLRTAAQTEASSPQSDRVSLLEAALDHDRREEAIGRGARIFAKSCAACHGRLGRGDGPGAADLDPPPRDLATRQFRFRTSPSGDLPRAEDLERSIRRGLPGTSMPAFGELFSSRELSDLISFIYSLQPAAVLTWTQPEAVSMAPVPPPTPSTISEGRALYLLLGCESCHGLNGSGRGPSAAGLTDEDGRPIRSTDFRYDPLKGGREPEAIVRTLRTGLNGAPMPSYDDAMVFAGEDMDSASLAGDVTEDDRTTVDEFLASLPSRADLAEIGVTGRSELRDRHLAALAHYVLSLSRRQGSWYRFLRQEPEREPRVAREPKESKKPKESPDPWGEQ